MKFKKTDGSRIVYDTLSEAVEDFCTDDKKCEECQLDGGPFVPCRDWVEEHPKEAAELLGFEIIEEKPMQEVKYICPDGTLHDTVESAIENFCESRDDCGSCEMYGQTRGTCIIPNVMNAEVCGKWAARNLGYALALTGIEAIEVETAEMIPPEDIKEVRIGKQLTVKWDNRGGVTARTPEEQAKNPVDTVKPPNVLRHRKICEELNRLYERKNHDYGDSFHQSYIEEGMAMARIRLGDKLNRFKTLSRLEMPFEEEQKVTDESIRDTLIDLANYVIMTVMEMDKPEDWRKTND